MYGLLSLLFIAAVVAFVYFLLSRIFPRFKKLFVAEERYVGIKKIGWLVHSLIACLGMLVISGALIFVLISGMIFVSTDPEQREKVQVQYDPETGWVNRIVYQDTTYVLAENAYALLSIEPSAEEVEISVNPRIWWFRVFSYRANAAGDPLWIYIYDKQNDIFYREDYDVFSDTFVVEATGQALVLQSYVLPSEPIPMSFNRHWETVVLRSTTNDSVYMRVAFVQVDDRWYMLSERSDAWEVSPSLMNMLMKES